MSARLEEKARRREERVQAEAQAAGLPPRKPPTRNATGESDFPGFQWIERNFSRMFAVSMILSVIFTLAIIALIVALILHLA